MSNSSYKYKELNMYHNSLALQGKAEGVGAQISLQQRMNPKKRMFQGDHNHRQNQFQIFGSAVEQEAKQREIEQKKRIETAQANQSQNRNVGHYMSEYNRTIEEAQKLLQNQDAQKMIQQQRPAGVIFDREYHDMIYKTNLDSEEEGSKGNSPQRFQNGGDNNSFHGSPGGNQGKQHQPLISQRPPIQQTQQNNLLPPRSALNIKRLNLDNEQNGNSGQISELPGGTSGQAQTQGQPHQNNSQQQSFPIHMRNNSYDGPSSYRSQILGRKSPEIGLPPPSRGVRLINSNPIIEKSPQMQHQANLMIINHEDHNQQDFPPVQIEETQNNSLQPNQFDLQSFIQQQQIGNYSLPSSLGLNQSPTSPFQQQQPGQVSSFIAPPSSQIGLQGPQSLQTVEQGRYFDRLERATLRQNAVYNTHMLQNGMIGWSPELEKEKIIARQKNVPSHHIFQNVQPITQTEEEMKRVGNRQIANIEMNDPNIRSYLKGFLDQQIQEKNLRKLGEHEQAISSGVNSHNNQHLLGLYDQAAENLLREMQYKQARLIGGVDQQQRLNSQVLVPNQKVTLQLPPHQQNNNSSQVQYIFPSGPKDSPIGSSSLKRMTFQPQAQSDQLSLNYNSAARDNGSRNQMMPPPAPLYGGAGNGTAHQKYLTATSNGISTNNYYNTGQHQHLMMMASPQYNNSSLNNLNNTPQTRNFTNNSLLGGSNTMMVGGGHDRRSSHGMFASMAARNMMNNNGQGLQ